MFSADLVAVPASDILDQEDKTSEVPKTYEGTAHFQGHVGTVLGLAHP